MTTLKIKKVANKNPKTQVAGFTAKVISNGTSRSPTLPKRRAATPPSTKPKPNWRLNCSSRRLPNICVKVISWTLAR